MGTKEISFNLHDDEDIYCPCGTNGRPLLDEDIVSTIQVEANNYKIKDRLNINFNIKKDSTVNEDEFVDAYKNVFSSKKKEKKYEWNRCLITGLILLCVGIIVLAFDVFLESRVPYFWFEFFNVFSWVFCWGGIEVLTVELIQIQMEINKINKLLNANIKFNRN